MQEKYDVIVIGAGSGGLTAAVGCAKVGKKVLLIEKEHLGGECTNAGCVPSKALLHYAKSFHTARTIAGKSTKAEKYRKGAFTYVRSIIDEFRSEETPEAFEKLGIDVLLGEATFVSKSAVQVAGEAYQFKKAIIATGTRPRLLKVAGMDEKDVLTNQNIFELSNIPEKLLIIGGGPIGMEMGQAFAMLGSTVTIADINSTFAYLEDPAVASYIQKHFESLGIRIVLNAYINRVENKQALFDIKQSESVTGQERIAYDKVLIAVGRIPNIPAGLEEAGVVSDQLSVHANKQHQTSNKHVYAIGDVAHRLKFTHTADDAARDVVAHIASKGLVHSRTKAVPKVTYTQPEIAQVGLSHTEAIQKYTEEGIKRIEVPFGANDRARTDGVTDGVLVVYVRRITGAILGAHIIGPSAGELISIFTLAIDKKISLWGLRKSIYAYPTYSLIIKKAGDYFFAQQIKTLKKDILQSISKHMPKLIALVLWGVVVWQLYAYKAAHGMDTTETALMVFDFITMTIWGPLLYILVYALRPLTFFPATALTILSGVFFGLGGGIVLTIIAANLSAAVAYGVGRFFSNNISLDDTAIGNWIVALRENTFSAVLTMRLIFLPFDGVSYILGALRTTFIPFLAATFLGTLLGIATFVSIGASIDIEEFKMDGITIQTINPTYIAVSVAIFVASLVLSRVLKKWKARG